MSGPSPFARRRWLIGVATALAVATVAVHGQQTTAQSAVNAAYAKFKDLKEGKNADYIPALAQVDPNLFGIAIVMPDGNVYTAGDVATQVSIQSISKVFTMAQVIQEQGLESIEKRIGVDATGARFNSIIAVEGVRTVVGTGARNAPQVVTQCVSQADIDDSTRTLPRFTSDTGAFTSAGVSTSSTARARKNSRVKARHSARRRSAPSVAVGRQPAPSFIRRCRRDASRAACRCAPVPGRIPRFSWRARRPRRRGDAGHGRLR